MMNLDHDLPLSRHFPLASRLALGCMGFGGAWDDPELPAGETDRVEAAVEAALAAGIRLFDHADIYTHGKAELAFGGLLRRRPSLRDQIVLQTKCGLILDPDGRAGGYRYDLSRDHILRAVEASLRRLQTDHIDILLLHRPDPLLEPEAIAEAFARLHASGKVRGFGVSNMRAPLLRWLQQALPMPLIANQIEMSLLRHDWLDADTCFNDAQGDSTLDWSGTLQHCQQQRVQLQAWGPLAKGWLSGAAVPDGAPATVAACAALVQQLASRHGVSREAIVLGWLLRHPARIQPVIGSTQAQRIAACAQAQQLTLSREEWFQLYTAARGRRLP